MYESFPLSSSYCCLLGSTDERWRAIAVRNYNWSASSYTTFSCAPVVWSHQKLPDLQVDQQHVIVDYKAGRVSCSDDALRTRVERAMQRLIEAMNPVAVDAQ